MAAINVIGLAGVSKAGKSTVFKFLKDKVPFAVEFKMAGHLKSVCQVVFGLTPEQLEDPILKEKELKELVYLDEENLTEVFTRFDIAPDFEKHIRLHISKVLRNPRQVLQYVGTEVLRTVDNDVHCKATKRNISSVSPKLVVITDLRFTNEFNFFSNDIETFNFLSTYVDRLEKEMLVTPTSHASEKAVLDIKNRCQTSIDNNGTLKDLKESVRLFLNSYKHTLGLNNAT